MADISKNEMASSVCNSLYIVNVTNEEDWTWTDAESLFITLAIPICTIIGVAANSIFLFTILRIRRMYTVVNFYLGSLAIADIVFLVLSMFYFFLLYFNSDIKYNFPIESSSGCWGLHIAWYLGVFASLNLITVMSFDRFVAICYPFKHTAYQGKAHAAKCIIGAVVFALIFAVGASTWTGKLVHTCLFWDKSRDFNYEDRDQMYIVHKSCNPISENADVIAAIIINVIYFGCLAVNITAYFRIIAALSKRQVKECTARANYMRIKDMRNQVARVLVINGTVFFLCYFPNRVSTCFYILNRYNGISVLTRHQSEIFLLISRILVLINSTLNPFIYAFSSEFYRTAFYEALGVKMKKRECDELDVTTGHGVYLRTSAAIDILGGNANVNDEYNL